MEGKTQPNAGKGKQEAPTYSTFPHTATHGASDKRCYHGKPEDWKRNKVERNFGGKVK